MIRFGGFLGLLSLECVHRADGRLSTEDPLICTGRFVVEAYRPGLLVGWEERPGQ